MNKRRVIETHDAPAAIGPYSQAVASGCLVFCSGQIPIDPKSGEIVDGDIKSQTHQVMKNLDAVIRAAGSNLSRVVKCTIFLTDLKDFALVNEVYGSYFPKDPPARATVQVAALPKGSRVEIEAIAMIDHAD